MKYLDVEMSSLIDPRRY